MLFLAVLLKDRGDPIEHFIRERRQSIDLGTKGGMVVRTSGKYATRMLVLW